MNKKGAGMLSENVIFIILNIAFFAMLLIFIYLNAYSGALIAQKTAKQTVLLIDASKPGTEIELNVEDVWKKKNEEIEWPIEIDNERNLVIVRLSKKNYYEYAFFNDVYVDYSKKEINNRPYLHMVIK